MVAVHASFIDTDMAALTNAPKDSPESVAQQVFDAVPGQPDRGPRRRADPDRQAELSRDQELIYPQVQEFWDAAVKGQQDRPRDGDQPEGSS